MRAAAKPSRAETERTLVSALAEAALAVHLGASCAEPVDELELQRRLRVERAAALELSAFRVAPKREPRARPKHANRWPKCVDCGRKVSPDRAKCRGCVALAAGATPQ